VILRTGFGGGCCLSLSEAARIIREAITGGTAEETVTVSVHLFPGTLANVLARLILRHHISLYLLHLVEELGSTRHVHNPSARCLIHGDPMDEHRVLGFYNVDLIEAAPGTVSPGLASLPASLSSFRYHILCHLSTLVKTRLRALTTHVLAYARATPAPSSTGALPRAPEN
jgi:hypothetical protein